MDTGQLHFRRLLETLPAGAYTCDRDGLITYFNPHAARLWGREPRLNHAEDRYCGSFRLFSAAGEPLAHDQCWMALAIRNEAEFNGHEVVIERPDGTRVTTLAHASPIRDDDGHLIGAVNVLVDISERKNGERALEAMRDELTAQLDDVRRLHESSARLATTPELEPILFETLRTAAALQGTDRGLLSLCEPGQDHIRVGASLGFDAAFLERVAQVRIGEGACGAAIRDRRRVIIEDTERDDRFAPYREDSRRAGFRAVHCTPLVTRYGRIVGVLSTHFREPHRPTDREIHLTDLLARHAVEFIENARLYEQLREADRRKDEFLAILAHELRNPLAPIRNALELMRRDAASPETVEQTREMMERQVNQMVRLVDDLMDASRINRNKLVLRRESVTLADVVRAAVESTRPIIDAAGHQLTVTLPREPIVLDADLARLAQVLSNLLNNAAKYTERGGTIALTVARDGGSVALRVRDDGIGIPPEKLGSIFEMFTQADRSLERTQSGLGIGLSLVRALVQLHGGTIEAFSDGPGKGSEFVVRLPVLLDWPARSRPRSSAPMRTPAPPRRVLVADDNEDSAASLAAMLRLEGHDVRVAHDGDAAVEIAAAFHPDVAFLDLGMPKLNGYDAARRMRAQANGSSLFLVAITGWGQDDDKRRSAEAGFNLHLVKPVDPVAIESLMVGFEAALAH